MEVHRRLPDGTRVFFIYHPFGADASWAMKAPPPSEARCSGVTFSRRGALSWRKRPSAPRFALRSGRRETLRPQSFVRARAKSPALRPDNPVCRVGSHVAVQGIPADGGRRPPGRRAEAPEAWYDVDHRAGRGLEGAFGNELARFAVRRRQGNDGSGAGLAPIKLNGGRRAPTTQTRPASSDAPCNGARIVRC
jgi:hypothetical protein